MSFYYQKKHRCEDDFCKKDFKKDDHKKDDCFKKTVVDFECDVVLPAIADDSTEQTITIEQSETAIASITFEHLKKDAEVLLNGILHLANTGDREAIVRIRRREGFPLNTSGTEIYRTQELELFGDYTAVPVLHCDDLCNVFCDKKETVSYVLTVQAVNGASGSINLSRPITFAGTVIK
ncbi:hypothetical protein [Bacillus sp. CHD6a]|uniref:hypothetical protein n=1 Tax=Bacillus sp. CHD6a TaxID=1643452 RepID=UPI0006CDD1C5|nr:hypothetical protein [Bacillus sp. CHD6a]KPB03557.1 hypothetical protein AAV98_16670 [Bacillus sp. CHD6a]